jgi:hypothetical protein
MISSKETKKYGLKKLINSRMTAPLLAKIKKAFFTEPNLMKNPTEK